MYVCRLHSFRDMNEKLALVDTNYPLQGGAVVYKKYIHRPIYPPILGHIQCVEDNKYITSLTFRQNT